MAVLRNVECRWASVQAPNTKFEPVYTIDVIISEEEKKGIQAEIDAISNGAKRLPKFKKEDGGRFSIRISQKTEDAEGNEMERPRVVGLDKQDFDQLVGNGSIVNVSYRAYRWDNSFGTGVNLGLRWTQVVKHVSYEDDIPDLVEDQVEVKDVRQDEDEMF